MAVAREVNKTTAPNVTSYCADFVQERVASVSSPDQGEYCHELVAECELGKELYDVDSDFTFCDECKEPNEGISFLS